MKRRLLWVAAAGVIAGAALCLAGWLTWTRPYTGPGRSCAPEDDALVRVPAGMTLTAAADTLVARGLLKDRRVLLLGARLTGRDRGLRAGLYRLSYGLSPRQLLEDLTTGLSVQVRVTVPEGLSAPETARILSEALGFPPSEFLAAADSLVRETALRGILVPGAADSLLTAARIPGLDAIFNIEPESGRRLHWCEGYLAPDTYLFGEGSSALSVAGHLVGTQLQRLAAASAVYAGETALEPHDLLTLASLVEAEARLESERPLVAAVYTNRLEQGWRLEADPTVAFVLEKKGRRLYYKDLEVDSPYNTYVHRGLPPGPIGSPGEAALNAAAKPDPACEAMYFVSDGAGGHVFSRTLREHEAAVQRFRRIRAESARR